MSGRKRLAIQGDLLVAVHDPLTPQEVRDRRTDRLHGVSRQKFGMDHRITFRPVRITYHGQDFDIQMNKCNNPFCRWFGLSQGENPKPLGTIGPNRRYRLNGSEYEATVAEDPNEYDADTDDTMEIQAVPHGAANRAKRRKTETKVYVCLKENIPSGNGIVFVDESFTPVSNVSVADEIARLVTHQSVVDDDRHYEFHREVNERLCPSRWLSPFNAPDAFIRRGKGKAKSTRWQCRDCGKVTNIVPSTRDNLTYGQQRSDVMGRFARLVLSRTPISQVCDALSMGRGTYYDKLELLYQRCLEFQERYEAATLVAKQFDTLWLASDQMVYSLNNIRQRNQSTGRYRNVEPRVTATNVIVTADMASDYVFRSDLCYDWDVTLDDVKQSTFFYQDDYMSLFDGRYGRLRRMSRYPQPLNADEMRAMTPEEQKHYAELQRDFARRYRYTPGMHINPSYTFLAHLWLLKHSLNVRDWRFVTDQDSSLISGITRVFSDEIRNGSAHGFIFETAALNVRQAYGYSRSAVRRLVEWAKAHGYDHRTIEWDVLAILILEESLTLFPLYETRLVNGTSHAVPRKGRDALRPHPLPNSQEGERRIGCYTNLSDLPITTQAELLASVDPQSVNRFIARIRRSINPLERPIASGRNRKSSFIYANTNPKYAHELLTILRTFYNFGAKSPSKIPKPRGGRKIETPAMRLGIATDVFHWDDIIYFR